MWNSSDTSTLGGGAWAEWDPELEAMKAKPNCPFHLTIFAFFPDFYDLRPISDEEQIEMSDFQESILSALLPEVKAVVVGRCWQSDLVRLEYRVEDAEKTDAKLKTILFKKRHSFSLDYQIFPDEKWEVPHGYWNGEIVREMQAESDAGIFSDEMAEMADTQAELGTDSFEVSEQRELESVKKRLEYAKGETRIPLWVRLVQLTANDEKMRSVGVALLKAALKEYPNNLEIVEILASVLILDRELADARFFLYRILDRNDGIPELYYHLACAEALAKRPDEAITALENALILSPVYAESAACDPNLSSLRARKDFQKLTGLVTC